MPARRHGGLLLVDLLLAHGVEFVFGVPGGQTMALYDGILERSSRIRHVLVRDERSGAYAADGYARVTGRVGVCDATVGPGAAKLPSGLGEALNASIPILALVGDLPRAWHSMRYRGAASQALDQARLLEPVTKWVAEVPAREELPGLVARAFREATTGRPGPSALIVPQDVLDEPWNGKVNLDVEAAARFGRFPSERPAPDPEAVEAAVRVLERAERPLLLAGGGALTAGAGESLRELAERLDAAVATTLSGKGLLDESHPLSVGVVGTLGTPAAATLLGEADVVLLVGTKAGSGPTFGWTLPRSDQQVVQLDVDPRELGRALPLEVGICADARVGLEALAETCARADRPGWRSRIEEESAAWRELRARETALATSPIAPQRVVPALERRLSAGDVLVCDASLSSGWGGVYVEQREPGRRVLTPRGLAGLGWSVPAAIGVAASRPPGRIGVLVGDGGLSYAVGELATLVQYQLPVTIVVLNNSSLGWIRWYRRISFGRGHETEDFAPVDFSAVAAGYGLPSVRVTESAELNGALERAFDTEGPALVEVISDAWQTPIFGHRRAIETAAATSYGG